MLCGAAAGDAAPRGGCRQWGGDVPCGKENALELLHDGSQTHFSAFTSSVLLVE